MSWVEDRYYKMNRIVLKIFGIWPYHRTKWTPVHVAIISNLFISFIVVQLAVFATHEVTIDLTVNILSFAIPSMFVLVFYCNYYFNADSFREITQHMYRDWGSFSDTMELAIMVDHARSAKMLTNMIVGLTFFIHVVVILCYAVAITLDVVAPINESRGTSIITHIISEYFIDQSKYYLVIVVHQMTYVCVAGMVVTMISMMILGYGLHACALFKVAEYRMRIVMDESVLQMPSPEREYVIYERIIRAVTLHRTAMRFCHLILPAHLEKTLTVLGMICVVSGSVNMFRFLNAIRYHMDDIMELFITATSVFVHFCYLFIGNHIGQQVTDNNSDIFDAVYNLPWYVASPSTKQLLLFILQRGSKKFYLSFSGLYDTSYECFTMVAMSSISYFTVLYSIN